MFKSLFEILRKPSPMCWRPASWMITSASCSRRSLALEYAQCMVNYRSASVTRPQSAKVLKIGRAA